MSEQLEGNLTDKLFALISIIVMLIVGYILGNHIATFIRGLEGTTIQWILYLALFLVVIIGTFGIPILISRGHKINPFNAITAYIYLMFIIPIIMILSGFIWDLATTLLDPSTLHADLATGTLGNPTPLLIIQLVIIAVVLVFAYIVPIVIMISDEPILAQILNGGEYTGETNQGE